MWPLAVLMVWVHRRVFFLENVWMFCRDIKNGRNNEVTVHCITEVTVRWSSTVAYSTGVVFHGPFPSSLWPVCQNGSLCQTNYMKMCSN